LHKNDQLCEKCGYLVNPSQGTLVNRPIQMGININTEKGKVTEVVLLCEKCIEKESLIKD